MTKDEYQDGFKCIIHSGLNKYDMWTEFDTLCEQMYKEEWFKNEMEEAILKYIDRFIDVKDIALGDKNYFSIDNSNLMRYKIK